MSMRAHTPNAPDASRRALERNLSLYPLCSLFSCFRPYFVICMLYFQQVTGSWTQAMALFAVVQCTSAALELPTGALSDILGRKPVMMIAYASMLLAIALYSSAATPLLYAGAALEGVCWALSSGNNGALLHDTLRALGRENEYARYSGRAGAMETVAFGASALLGGALAAMLPYRLTFALTLPAMAVSVALSACLREPPREKPTVGALAHLMQAMRIFAGDKRLRDYSMLSNLSGALSESCHQFSPSYWRMLLPEQFMGLLSFTSSLFSALGFWLAARVNARLGERRSLYGVGLLSWAVTAAQYALHVPAVSAGLNLLSNVLYGTHSVARDSMLQRAFSERHRASMGSLDALMSAALVAACELLVGMAADRFGPVATLLAATLLRLPLLLLVGRVLRARAAVTEAA